MSLSNSPARSQGNSGTATPSTEDASGYLLLTIEHAEVRQVYDDETMTLARGELRLECVSLPIPPETGRQTANPFSPSPSDPPVPTHDFWLVIKVGPTFDMPVIPTQPIQAQQAKDGITYTVPSPHIPNASLIFTLPLPRSQADLEDLDSLEVLLRQYGVLGPEASALTGVTAPVQGSTAFKIGGSGPSGTASPPLAPEELRGQIVLINEDNGEVVGQLDQRLDLEEDQRLAGEDKNRPVMLDFGHLRDGQDALKVKVKSVPEEDMDDWLLGGASKISKGILSFGSWSSRQMLSGADKFIKNSTPAAEPVHLSPQTKEGFVKFHTGTVKVATVTKSTLSKIHGAVSTVAEKTYDYGVAPAYNAYRRGSEGAYQPRLPPRPPQSAPVTPLKTAGNPPPIPAKPGHLGGQATSATMPLPTHLGNIQAAQQAYNQAPSYSDKYSSEPGGVGSTPVSPTAGRPGPAPPVPPKKKALLGRLLLAGEVVLTSLEATAHDLINNGTIAASSAAGHKYGPDAGQATALVGGSVKNVAVVYIDVAGVGRRAILKSTAKGFVRAKLRDGETVKLQAEGHGQDVKAGEVEVEHAESGRAATPGGTAAGETEIVVGMPETGRSTTTATENREKDVYRRR
ncbi:hypothetical protein IAU60_004146 [Kwoniella sp. DSM 27419]